MKRTGDSKIAVVGWGRGMGHKGHMYLADAVITQAINMKADPYFFVSKTIGKDDPVYPEEKVRIYQKVFPQHANIFEPQGNLNQALQDLAKMGYQGVVVVVGADQKQAFQYLEKPNKEGVPVYQSMGLKKLRVISRQETNSKFAGEEGPRATPMREILLDPNATEEDKFKVWRRDMPEQLGDREVLDIMNKAESRLVHDNAPKVLKSMDKKPATTKTVKSMSKKAAKLKEAIINFRTRLEPEEKKPEPLGYKHLFKQPDQENKPVEKHYRGWEEYEKEHNPDEVEEGRIIDANAKVNLYYVTPKGARQIVFQNIPQRMLDKAIMVLRNKYPQIKDTDIEMRPASISDYSLNEFAIDKPDDGDGRSKLIGSIVRLLQAGNKVDFFVPGIRGHVVGSGGNGDTLVLKRWKKPYSKTSYSLQLDSSDDSRFVLKMINPDYYQVVQAGDMDDQNLNEFAPAGGGDDGFNEETLKMLASQWYNGDEDPRVERTLIAAGWEIGQDEGYDDEPGVFVVQSGDTNGDSYLSWPAHELRQHTNEDYLDE